MKRGQKLALKSRVDKLMIDINAKSPEGINRGFISAYDNWLWLKFRGNLIKDGIYGAIITLGFAFIILFLTT